MSVLLGRRVYAVFGTLGIAGYLGHLSYKVFRDSMMFPFALTLVGIAVIALGLLYHKKQAAVAAWIEANIPRRVAEAAARARAVISRSARDLIDNTLPAASASRTPHSLSRKRRHKVGGRMTRSIAGLVALSR